jgi:branched-chain amino acid transport system ATP-binding protein
LTTLKRLKEAGLTILLVEQNVRLALAQSDYAYVGTEGRIFMEGLPAELAAKPEIRRAYWGRDCYLNCWSCSNLRIY